MHSGQEAYGVFSFFTIPLLRSQRWIQLWSWPSIISNFSFEDFGSTVNMHIEIILAWAGLALSGFSSTHHTEHGSVFPHLDVDPCLIMAMGLWTWSVCLHGKKELHSAFVESCKSWAMHLGRRLFDLEGYDWWLKWARGMRCWSALLVGRASMKESGNPITDWSVMVEKRGDTGTSTPSRMVLYVPCSGNDVWYSMMKKAQKNQKI